MHHLLDNTSFKRYVPNINLYAWTALFNILLKFPSIVLCSTNFSYKFYFIGSSTIRYCIQLNLFVFVFKIIFIFNFLNRKKIQLLPICRMKLETCNRLLEYDQLILSVIHLFENSICVRSLYSLFLFRNAAIVAFLVPEMLLHVTTYSTFSKS